MSLLLKFCNLIGFLLAYLNDKILDWEMIMQPPSTYNSQATNCLFNQQLIPTNLHTQMCFHYFCLPPLQNSAKVYRQAYHNELYKVSGKYYIRSINNLYLNINFQTMYRLCHNYTLTSQACTNKFQHFLIQTDRLLRRRMSVWM